MSGESSDSYAEFDVQHITAQAQKTEGTGGVEWDYIEEPNSGDLDSNEVAELVYYNRRVHMFVKQDGNLLGDASSARAEFGFGINLPNADAHLPNRTGDGVSLEPNDNTSDQGELKVNSVDDQGILDSLSTTVSPQIEDSAEGTAAGAEYSEPSEREIDFRERFGHGPYLDQTDDLSLFVEINNYGISDARVDFLVDLQLVYDVYTVEGGRAEFARPGDSF